jgi:hypothetical protein
MLITLATRITLLMPFSVGLALIAVMAARDFRLLVLKALFINSRQRVAVNVGVCAEASAIETNRIALNVPA